MLSYGSFKVMLGECAPKDQPWGIRELGAITPDGHRMVIGHLIDR